ncbi:uncharacterized protein LOC120850499 [Ixodes scapularis]|uniref:uncharacterized protein LOC120850499 n=1 Tax=Ixodes scapularis TaxID=6945 RepID=UPI001C392B8D|nr:uncharacterized protein LOC120850499 [Ixodes scapularis]
MTPETPRDVPSCRKNSHARWTSETGTNDSATIFLIRDLIVSSCPYAKSARTCEYIPQVLKCSNIRLTRSTRQQKVHCG